MIWVDSPQAKSIRSRYQAMLQASPSLREEYQSAMRARRPSLLMMFLTVTTIALGLPMVFAVVPSFLIFLLNEHGGPVSVFAVAGFLTTMGTLAFPETLLAQLQRSRTVAVFSHLPASDRDLARTVWNQTFAYSLCGLYFILLFFGAVAYLNELSISGWAVSLLLAMLQWSFVVTAGTWLAVSFPRFRFGQLGSLLLIAGMSTFYFNRPILLEIAVWCTVLNPGGWPGLAVWHGYMNENTLVWIAIIPSSLLLLLSPILRERLLKHFAIQEFDTSSREKPLAVFDGRFLLADQNRLHIYHVENLMPEELEEFESLDEVRDLNGLSVLHRPAWSQCGWIEQTVWKYLKPRERTIAGFLTGDTPRWTFWWKMASGALLVILILYGLEFLKFPLNQFINKMAPALCFYLVIISSMYDRWQGLRTTPCLGSYASHFASYPIGVREISRVMFKISFIKSLFYALLIFPFVVYMMGPMGFLIAVGAVGASQLIMSWQIAYGISRGFSLPALKWSNCWMVLVVLLIPFGTMFGLAFSLAGFNPGLHISLLAAGVTLVFASTLGVWRFFEWLVASGRLDLATNQLNVIQKQFDYYQVILDKSELRMQRVRYSQKKHGRIWGYLRLVFGMKP